MVGTRSVAALLALLLVAPLVAPAAHRRPRRQLADDDTLQPLESGTTWRAPREPPAAISGPRLPTGARRSSSPSRTPRPPRPPRQSPATKDDIPEFDRNKVSLDFPGSLFGPSVSLLIRTTKIVGDVIQNSAVRYQSFLRLFRPLFRGQFEIKGLDPPTTTTTTTTSRPPSPADNEVRRR